MYELNRSLKKILDERWRESQPLWQQWWYEADLDTKMATGQQDYWNTYFATNYRNQKILMFNKILRVKNMIEGYQRRNRLATITSAVHTGDEEGADQRSEVLHWTHMQDGTYEKISDCFGGSNTVGLNLLNIWMDYREDPESGEIRSTRLPFNSFLMDNYWTQPDLSDCDWIWTRRYITRKQLLSIHPDMKNEVPALAKGYGAKDGRFQFLAQNWYQYQQELYAYDEYWEREYRQVFKLLDKKTGEVVEWKGDRDQFKALKRINPNVDLIKATVPTVKQNILINDHVFYEEMSPYGIDIYPFVPFVAYHYPEVQNYAYRYQGVVRNIRDSQIELNRRRNRMLDILDSQVQSGLLVKEDALVNPEDAFLNGPGRVQFFKNSANLAQDVQHVPPPAIPQSLFELEKVLNEDIMAIAGVNEELFGESDNKGDMSGFLHQLRTGNALTSLQNLFDRLNQSQMMVGEVFTKLAEANFSSGKLERILGKTPSEDWEDLLFTKYRCACEEAQLTTTQKQTQFIQAMQMKQMGFPIPMSYLMDKATLQGKKELMEAIQADEQAAAALQQAQATQALEEQMMKNRQLESQIELNFAGAEERKTRAISNIGLAKERASQSIQDRATAALNNAKALHEMDHADNAHKVELAKLMLEMQKIQAMAAQKEEDEAQERASEEEAEIERSNTSTKSPTQ